MDCVDQVLESLESVVEVLLGVRRHDPGLRTLLFAVIGPTDGEDFALVYHVDEAIEYLLKREPDLSAVHGDEGIINRHVLHSFPRFLI